MYRTHNLFIRGGQSDRTRRSYIECQHAPLIVPLYLVSSLSQEALSGARDLRTLSTLIEARMVELCSEIPLCGVRFGNVALLSSLYGC